MSHSNLAYFTLPAPTYVCVRVHVPSKLLTTLYLFQVYCRTCYENRKKHSKGKDSGAAKTGFRYQPSDSGRSVKVYCAVEDCESEVSTNSVWVGIFM